MNQFKEIKDVLPLGKSIINVKPLPEFEKGDDGRWHPKQGTQQMGIVKNGKNAGSKFYKYDSDVKYFDDVAKKKRTCQVIAWTSKDKAILDTGRVEINIIEKPVLLNGEPTYTKEGKPAFKRMSYINNIPQVGASIGDQYQAEYRMMEEEIPIIEKDNYEEK
jgi:hypothetical protein